MAAFGVLVTFHRPDDLDQSLSAIAGQSVRFRELVIVDNGPGEESGAIVERDAQGQLRVPESGDAAAGIGTASGGLIGMLIGVLGGPIGLLLGWSVGAATGALYDADRLDTGDEAIAAFGRLLPPGGNAILAVTNEITTDGLEQFAAGFGGKVTRRPLDEVLAELEAQDEAAREAEDPRFAGGRRAAREHVVVLAEDGRDDLSGARPAAETARGHAILERRAAPAAAGPGAESRRGVRHGSLIGRMTDLSRCAPARSPAGARATAGAAGSRTPSRCGACA